MDGAAQASQHRDLDELDCDPKVNQDMLVVQLLPIWAWRLPIAVRSSLEVENTQRQHPQWELLDQQPLGVSWNGCKWLVGMPGVRRPRLYPFD